MTNKICLLTLLLIAALGVGCATNQDANVNSTANQAQATTSPGPDNSEIATTVNADGTRTETRTFKDNGRISKVTVTTRNGVKTVR